MAVGTLLNDDGVARISVGDTTVTEDSSGSVIASFTVTIAPASGSVVTVDYATQQVCSLSIFLYLSIFLSVYYINM